jgi:CelD/BcsL family acetyltransferase involved in cellulose biosynthesis
VPQRPDRVAQSRDAHLLATDLEALEPLEAEWRALAVARGNPHLTPELYKAWVRGYEPQVRPYVPVLLDRDGRLLGLIPLAITTGVIRTVQFAATDFFMHMNPVARPEDEDEVGAAAGRLLASDRGQWHILTVENAAEGAPWVDRMIEALSSDHRGRLVQARSENTWFLAELAGGWDGYLASKSGSFRSKLGGSERALARKHDVAARQTEATNELGPDLETLFHLHLLRRTAQGGSTFDDLRLRRTMEEFAAGALEQGWLRLRVLELDGQPAAANLCFQVGDRWTGYVLGWDPRWAEAGLGRIAMVDGMRAAAEEGASEFDLQVGRSDFKARHATTERPVQTVSLYPRRIAAYLALRRAARRFLRGARRHTPGRRSRSAAESHT